MEQNILESGRDEVDRKKFLLFLLATVIPIGFYFNSLITRPTRFDCQIQGGGGIVVEFYKNNAASVVFTNTGYDYKLYLKLYTDGNNIYSKIKSSNKTVLQIVPKIDTVYWDTSDSRNPSILRCTKIKR
jgi:hypothetical protein